MLTQVMKLVVASPVSSAWVWPWPQMVAKSTVVMPRLARRAGARCYGPESVPTTDLAASM